MPIHKHPHPKQYPTDSWLKCTRKAFSKKAEVKYVNITIKNHTHSQSFHEFQIQPKKILNPFPELSFQLFPFLHPPTLSLIPLTLLPLQFRNPWSRNRIFHLHRCRINIIHDPFTIWSIGSRETHQIITTWIPFLRTGNTDLETSWVDLNTRVFLCDM